MRNPQHEVWRRHVRTNYIAGDEIPQHWNDIQVREARLITLKVLGPRKGVRHGNERHGRKNEIRTPIIYFPVIKRQLHG
jgi:hypothetical protein